MKKIVLLLFFLVFAVNQAQTQEFTEHKDWIAYIVSEGTLTVPTAYTQATEAPQLSLFSLLFPSDTCGVPLSSLTLLSPSDSSLPEVAAVATVKIGGHSFNATATFVHDEQVITIPLAFRDVPAVIRAAQGGRSIVIEIPATTHTKKISLTFSLMGFSSAYEQAEGLCKSLPR